MLPARADHDERVEFSLYLSASDDIDALDYVFMYLNDEKHSHSELHDINDVYVLDNFRPVVTNKNWRIDCGVAVAFVISYKARGDL